MTVRDLVPFLMFCGDHHGKAAEALTWYRSVFADSRIVHVERYGPDEDQPEGSVRLASFEVRRSSGCRPPSVIPSGAP
jgi:predicted 3-demethylubiquinone-9 3-methyltransferase (glyoxalase superfamily)